MFRFDVTHRELLARGTGKTSLLKARFLAENSLFIDLLSPSEFERFFRDPEELSKVCKSLGSKKEWVIIDEIQKVPALLDVVHQHIENSYIFYFTE